jgi:hypothetical protein
VFAQPTSLYIIEQTLSTNLYGDEKMIEEAFFSIF